MPIICSVLIKFHCGVSYFRSNHSNSLSHELCAILLPIADLCNPIEKRLRILVHSGNSEDRYEYGVHEEVGVHSTETQGKFQRMLISRKIIEILDSTRSNSNWTAANSELANEAKYASGRVLNRSTLQFTKYFRKQYLRSSVIGPMLAWLTWLFPCN